MLHNETVSKNFGKYRDQFVEFQSWVIPGEFFFINASWIKSHTINQMELAPFDYIKYSSMAPKIHTPDRLESELVSIKKTNDFVYEGQVLINSQTYHGFGRILQYQGGKDSGNAYIYEGWFINGLPQGIGRKVYQDGTIYEGQFRFGLENGEGERDIV